MTHTDDMLDAELEDVIQLERYRRTKSWDRVRPMTDSDRQAARILADVKRRVDAHHDLYLYPPAVTKEGSRGRLVRHTEGSAQGTMTPLNLRRSATHTATVP